LTNSANHYATPPTADDSTGDGRQLVGVSGGGGGGGGAVERRAWVEVGRGDVETGAVGRELEDADAARSVRRRVGVARALSPRVAHVARALHARRVAAADPRRRRQLALHRRLLRAAPLLLILLAF